MRQKFITYGSFVGLLSLALVGCATPFSGTTANNTSTTNASSGPNRKISTKQLVKKFHLPYVSPTATMKTYSITSDKSLGKTNAKDNAKFEKNTIYGPFVSDLNVQTTVLNMKKVWHMKFTKGFNNLTPNYLYTGSIGDPKDGLKLRYMVGWDGPNKVLGIDCRIYSDQAGKAISLAQIQSVASVFFGYCATLPYKNSQPAEARKWVEDNIGKIHSPGVAKKIGNVWFTMWPMQTKHVQWPIVELQIKP